MGLLDRISFKKQDAEPPEAIDVADDGEIRILWPGGPGGDDPRRAAARPLPVRGLRRGGHRARRSSIPPPSRRTSARSRIVAVGNYAVQIHWSDGHSTGIYSWETLRRASGLKDDGDTHSH